MKEASPHDPYFEPIPPGEHPNTPEAITGQPRRPPPVQPPAPLRWKTPLVTMLILMLVIAAWELIQFYQYLSRLHWSLALAYLALLAWLIGHCAWGLRRYVKACRQLDKAGQLRQRASQMLDTHSTIQKTAFLQELQRVYDNCPQLAEALAQLPDYSDDAETIDHINQHFLGPRDEQALMAVARCSRDNALFITLSPFTLADMLLSLWRTLKMIDQVSLSYGVMPTLPGRLKLARQLLQQLAMTAGADLLLDQLLDFSSNRLASTLSKQAATGLGVGLYSMRIGFYAMKQCRPIPFHKDTQPNLRQACIDILKALRKNTPEHSSDER